jgi:PhzF family phenazine biosynthesis protein
MSIPLLQVDAFARRPFEGNPAAVCFLPTAADADWMQQVAAENNLSETAFLVERADGDGYDLRWFTPAAEVDLCGHATLGSAHALWETGRLAADAEARFHTRSGLLTARRANDLIEMDFPAETVEACEPPPGIGEAIGATATFVGANRMDYLAELADEATVRNLAPDFRAIAGFGKRGLMVTARAADSGGGYDYVARYFAPQFGIDEDPVTGSAHCAMGPYWAAKLDKEEVTGYQASARGGTVQVRVAGARVKLRGSAVTTLTAELLA